jgi:hypothetical protein
MNGLFKKKNEAPIFFFFAILRRRIYVPLSNEVVNINKLQMFVKHTFRRA